MRRPEEPKKVTVYARIDASLDDELGRHALKLGIDKGEVLRRAIRLKVHGPEVSGADLTLEEEAVLFAFRTLRICSPELADACRRVLQALLDAQPGMSPPHPEGAGPGLDAPREGGRGEGNP
jgi:hypothetical protein